MAQRKIQFQAITDAVFSTLVDSCTSIRQISIQLNMVGSSSQVLIKRRISEMQLDVSHFKGHGWSRGLTKEQHPGIATAALKTSISTRGKVGHKHSCATRQKLSKAASGKSFGNNARVKWHAVKNGAGELVQVQGRWEQHFAEWLNDHTIEWQRPVATFAWKKSADDIQHAYHPDFYLPAADLFVEIKGFLWKDDMKQIDDELKLKLVIEQNPTLRLIVLMKQELKALGVI